MPPSAPAKPAPTSPLSPTVENYLKHLFVEQKENTDERLPTGRLAAALRVSPGTATAMVKSLKDGGLVNYKPRGGVRLTRAGERRALDVIRRHRLVELFLVRTLGLDWSEVHAEAEELEHAISAKVLCKIDALLGYPQFDPHGDPIPGAEGRLAAVRLTTLMDSPLHTRLRVARVVAQEPEFLRTLQRLGLTLGSELVVEARDKFADSITVHPPGRPPAALGTGAASKVLVEPV